jgi:O-acetyl-ADP-ribose deacetylase (regulator of RNase III)
VIESSTGDLFTADVDVLVNAVNTHGVMGAGLAL